MQRRVLGERRPDLETQLIVHEMRERQQDVRILVARTENSALGRVEQAELEPPPVRCDVRRDAGDRAHRAEAEAVVGIAADQRQPVELDLVLGWLLVHN